MAPRAVEALVTGRVQAVGFRYSAVRQATALGVAGWVRNEPDGSVRVWVEGDSVAVGSMIEWLHVGPSYAVVRGVQVSERTPSGFSSFEIN